MTEKIVDIDNIDGSYLFNIKNDNGNIKEAIIVENDGKYVCWLNYCRHITTVKLHDGEKLPRRNGEIICNNHGAIFDIKTGECHHGPCKGSSLIEIDITIEDGSILLTDSEYSYQSEGGISSDDMPDSTAGESDF